MAVFGFRILSALKELKKIFFGFSAYSSCILFLMVGITPCSFIYICLSKRKACPEPI